MSVSVFGQMMKRGQTACSWHVLARSNRFPAAALLTLDPVNAHSYRNRCQKASGASQSLIKIGCRFHKAHISNYANKHCRWWHEISCFCRKETTTRLSSLAPEPGAIAPTEKGYWILESWKAALMKHPVFPGPQQLPRNNLELISSQIAGITAVLYA